MESIVRRRGSQRPQSWRQRKGRYTYGGVERSSHGGSWDGKRRRSSKGKMEGGKARGGPSEEGGRPLIVRDQARREKVEERGYFSVGFWRFQVG
jgi:hypothetical protein